MAASLREMLGNIPCEDWDRFLTQAYNTGVEGAAEQIIDIYGINPCPFELKDLVKKVISEQLAEAEGKSNPWELKEWQERKVRSNTFSDDEKESFAVATGDEFVSILLEEYKRWNTNAGIRFLKELGREDEVQQYILEAAQSSDLSRRSRLYLRLGMVTEAIDAKLQVNDLDGAIDIAEKNLEGKELRQFCKRTYNDVEGKGEDNGFPIQIKLAKLLGDELLIRRTKKSYVTWIMQSEEVGYLGLIKKVGTPEQLREMHERIVDHYQQGWIPGQFVGEMIKVKPQWLAEAAEKAFVDLGERKYGVMAMEAYHEAGDLNKELEIARSVAPKKVEMLETTISLLR